jgi:hypothetical protein
MNPNRNAYDMSSTAAVSSRPMPPKSHATQQITVRVPVAAVESADELVGLLSEPELPLLRADVLRTALARGLAVLREEAAAKGRKRKRT